MAIYILKQAPDDYAESTGLAKYGRSRMPGCTDVYQAAMDRAGNYITGLTEDELTELKNKTIYDLSNVSDFWKSFKVVIPTDRDKIFNTNINPIDYVSYKMLIANGYAAPSKEALSDFKYKDALYYVHSQEQEDAKEVSTLKKKDKARSLLLDIANDKEKMLLFGQYLEGVKYDSKLEEPTLYRMLRAFIDSSTENTLLFLSLFDKDINELQTKILIDKALKRRLISKVSSGKGKYIYQYGQVTLGSEIEDVYKNLSNIEFAPELDSIRKELNK